MTLIDDVLQSLRLQSAVFCRMTLAGDWGLAKDALSGAPFHLLLTGRAWVTLKGSCNDLELFPGDLIVMPHGHSHRIASTPTAETVPFRQVAVDLKFGEGKPTTTLISGIFDFGGHRRNPLIDALPQTLLMRAQAGSTVAAITSLLDAELLSGLPGADCVGARLADILFIQIVRHYLASTSSLPKGWLRGITDKEIGPALAIIHRAPERMWSVETLGREFGMSRSRFAKRFQDVVGQSPLEYLTHWRMYRAAEQLSESKVVLPELAASVGYKSEVSFSKAFKRWAGTSPAQYRHRVIGPKLNGTGDSFNRLPHDRYWDDQLQIMDDVTETISVDRR
jgi:AraC-like DNA-binding protein